MRTHRGHDQQGESVKITQVSMTPADAAKLLEHNSSNRKLSAARVAGLAAIIARSEWVLDGNPVKVATDGSLIDGQHRLSAIVEAGQAVPVILITGLPSDTRLTVDAGKPRTFGDYLRIHKVPNELTVAAAVRAHWAYENGLFQWDKDWFSRPTPSHRQLWEHYLKREDEFHEAVSRAATVARIVRVARAPLAAAWLIFSDVECERCGPAADDADEFYNQLAMRSVGDFQNVTMFIKLMNRKERTEVEVGRTLYSQTVQLALLIKTWNAYREGRNLGVLRWTRGGANKERFPAPH